MLAIDAQPRDGKVVYRITAQTPVASVLGCTFVSGDRGKVNPNSEERPAVDELTGGPGRDQFVGSGADRLLARDGVPESSIGCFEPRFRTAAFSGGFAEIDRQDTSLPAPRSCTTVTQAPVAEKPKVGITSRYVKVTGRTAKVKIVCVGTCAGRVSLKLAREGSKTVSVKYRAKGSKTISLKLSAGDAARVKRAGTDVTATVTEKGVKGPRSAKRAVTVKR